MPVTRLHDLFAEQGQSPWIDNLRRDWLRDGTLAGLVDQGVRGVTSNPTIFAKAIAGQDTYDADFASLIRTKSVDDAYWDLVVDDVLHALDVLRPVYDARTTPRGRRPRRGTCTRGSIARTCSSRSPRPPKGSRRSAG
jgi:transaldolase